MLKLKKKMSKSFEFKFKYLRRKRYYNLLLSRIKNKFIYRRNTLLMKGAFYRNFIYKRLISIYLMWILIYTKLNTMGMAKIVYSLWVRFFNTNNYLLATNKYLFTYLFSNVFLFKHYYYLSTEQFIIRNN